MAWARLAAFLAPLSLVMMAIDVAEMFVNASIVRSLGAEAKGSLAAFGIAYHLTRVSTSYLEVMRHTSLVLVHSGRSARVVLRLMALIGAAVVAGLLTVATTPLALWLSGLRAGAAEESDLRVCLVLLCGVPLLDGSFQYLCGLLLQHRLSLAASIASVADVAAQVAVIMTLLQTPLRDSRPLAIPVAALYCGRLAKVAVAWRAVAHTPSAFAQPCALPPPAARHRAAKPAPLPEAAAPGRSMGTPDATPLPPREGGSPDGTNLLAASPREPAEVGEPALTAATALRFSWPLAANEFVARVSRPIINAVVVSEAGGITQVAALALSYPLAHIFYGWLNEIKSMPTAFRRDAGAFARIPAFTAACVAGVVLASCACFYSPAHLWVLRQLMGASAELAAACSAPLRVFAFFGLSVGLRALLTGAATLHKQTHVLAPSGIVRLICIGAALAALPWLGVRGASRGVGALIAGFYSEALTVLLAAARLGMSRLLRLPAADAAAAAARVEPAPSPRSPGRSPTPQGSPEPAAGAELVPLGAPAAAAGSQVTAMFRPLANAGPEGTQA